MADNEKQKDYQRFGVYYDIQMQADEEVIKDELERMGVKASRSAAVRYALAQEARRIKARRKAPKK